MPLELFIYFLLPGGAEGSACSVCGPPAGPQSRVSLRCSSFGTPPQCPPCRRWGRRRRSISQSPHSLAKEALGISRGLRKIRGEQWDRSQVERVKRRLSHHSHTNTHTGDTQVNAQTDALEMTPSAGKLNRNDMVASSSLSLLHRLAARLLKDLYGA